MNTVVTNPPKYTFLKDNIFYFQKSIPVDLRDHYLCSRILFNLRTEFRRNAETSAKYFLSKLEAYWLSSRTSCQIIPAPHLLAKYDVNQPKSITLAQILEC